jgi:hypothetical protein
LHQILVNFTYKGLDRQSARKSNSHSLRNPEQGQESWWNAVVPVLMSLRDIRRTVVAERQPKANAGINAGTHHACH